LCCKSLYFQWDRGGGQNLCRPKRRDRLSLTRTLSQQKFFFFNERAAIEGWFADRADYGVKGAAKKGSRKRVNPLKMQQSTEIDAFSPKQADDRLFPIHRSQFWRVVHRYAMAAGIPRRKCKSHTLKHTICKHLLREGATVDELMGWLGWKSLETPLWYLRPNEEELGDRVGSIIRNKAGFRPVSQTEMFPSNS